MGTYNSSQGRAAAVSVCKGVISGAPENRVQIQAIQLSSYVRCAVSSLFHVLDVWSPHITFMLRTDRDFLKLPLWLSLICRVRGYMLSIYSEYQIPNLQVYELRVNS